MKKKLIQTKNYAPEKDMPFIKRPSNIIDRQWWHTGHSECFNDFEYYVNTSYEELKLDGSHDLPWIFFTQEGCLYILKKVIKKSYEAKESIGMDRGFVTYFGGNPALLFQMLEKLSHDQVDEIKEWLKYLLRGYQQDFYGFPSETYTKAIASLLEEIEEHPKQA